jgi:hypothetical protein
MGYRSVYFVVDIADYFLQPIYFGVNNVEFKIGSELDLLNRTLSGLRLFKKVSRLKIVDWLLPTSRALIYAASLFGTSQGSVIGSPERPAWKIGLCGSVYSLEKKAK